MGSGKGNQKRVSSTLVKTDNPFHELLSDFRVIVSSHTFMDIARKEGNADTSYREYYLPELTSEEFEKNLEENLSYVLTEVLHDVMDQKLISPGVFVSKDNKAEKAKMNKLLDKLNYKDFMIQYNISKKYWDTGEDLHSMLLVNKVTNKDITNMVGRKQLVTAECPMGFTLKDVLVPIEVAGHLFEKAVEGTP